MADAKQDEWIKNTWIRKRVLTDISDAASFMHLLEGADLLQMISQLSDYDRGCVLHAAVVMLCEADMVPCTPTRRVVLKGETMKRIDSSQELSIQSAVSTTSSTSSGKRNSVGQDNASVLAALAAHKSGGASPLPVPLICPASGMPHI